VWVAFRGAGVNTASYLINTSYPIELLFESLNLHEHIVRYFNFYTYNDLYLLLTLLCILYKHVLSKSRKTQPRNLRQLSTLK
jgi:hypothetical protein